LPILQNLVEEYQEKLYVTLYFLRIMQKIAIGIEYNGTDYYGWQSQCNVMTVQATVEAALSRVADHPVSIVCAGRTDAGVHALGQVAHFESDAKRSLSNWVRGGNVYLPPSISIRWAKWVDSGFHARFSAVARRYQYLIYNHPVRSSIFQARATGWHRPLNEIAMQQAARYLLGQQDFNAFRSINCQAKSSIRTVQILEVTRCGDFIKIDIKANAFLHHMVRNIAGVLIAVGEGKRPPEWAQAVLAMRDRKEAGITAPSVGLCLVEVEYPAVFGIPVPSVREGVAE
jgi:tRNA pseudouridine38-40 synthase